MKSIAIFCGSSTGNNPIYTETAYELGKYLAQQNIQIVYGGARVGLMGALAEGALSENGKVIGVMPHFLANKREVPHENLKEFIRVDTMHERKQKISELVDGFIALPGGFGTFDELFEILTWGQLDLHKNPVGLLNINHFYNPLLQMLDSMVTEGFLKQENQKLLISAHSISELMDKMKNYKYNPSKKWI